MLMMTVRDAAARLGCEARTVNNAIRDGRLTAQRMGHFWVVLEDDKFKAFTLGASRWDRERKRPSVPIRVGRRRVRKEAK